MALYGNLHPAQLKDSVTSESPPYKDSHEAVSMLITSRSPRRMHHCWSPHAGRREGTIDNGTGYSGRNESCLGSGSREEMRKCTGVDVGTAELCIAWHTEDEAFA